MSLFFYNFSALFLIDPMYERRKMKPFYIDLRKYMYLELMRTNLYAVAVY